jgi:hypothetical protein
MTNPTPDTVPTDLPPTDPGEPFTPPDRDPRWTALAAPFPPAELEWKPQPLAKYDSNDARRAASAQCDARRADRDGRWCGGYHTHPSIHIAYVGHAGITNRLNTVVGPDGWSWEFAHRDIPHDLLLAAIQSGDREIAQMILDNAPPLYSTRGLWIKLTVLGTTRYGFGDAGEARDLGPKEVKEIIGDALRNGAMRFGVGLYLWGKSASARELQNASGVTSGQVRLSPDHVEDAPEPIGRGERPRTADGRPAPRREQPAGPPPADDESIEAAGTRAVRRAREQHADAREQARHPDPAPTAAQPRDDGAVSALVDEILSCTDSKRFRGPLWNIAGQVAPGGRDTDVRRMLSDDAADLLGLDRAEPIPLGLLVQRAAEHFDKAAESVAMSTAPVPADPTR